ncbi:MAG: GNAT family N-acetyltransferase [Clostridiales bacterium]|jgi:ribosomal-protein-alanine N-acetyltransferase|nr:GNAT family N-acetyltransferase [Clostridiales bacterium]
MAYPPTLETKRLLLRPYDLKDAADIFEYAGDVETTRYMSWDTHKNIYETLDFLNGMRIRYENNTTLDYAFVLKSSGKVIGGGGCFDTGEFPHTAKIGYILNKAYWGQGLAVEAMSAVFDYLFNTLKVHRIEAYHYAENEKSGKVMVKLGMSYEGTKPDGAFVRGAYKTLKFYGILNFQFSAVKTPFNFVSG